MKRLLLVLPLLIAPAQAGNLGAADQVLWNVHAKSPDYSQRSFKVHVGNNAGQSHLKSGKAVAAFSEDRFTITTDPDWIKKLKKQGYLKTEEKLDESGITPEQVISFSYFIEKFGCCTNHVVFQILYRDSTGETQIASFNFSPKFHREAKAFNNIFLDWMSTGTADQPQLP